MMNNFFPQRRRGAEDIFRQDLQDFWFRFLILLILFILSKKLFVFFVDFVVPNYGRYS